MEGKDNIKELFSQKLGNYEAKVNPELWAKISTQVAAGASTTTAAGISLFAKVAIGVGVSAAMIATVVVLSSTSEETVSEQPSTKVEVKEQPANLDDKVLTPEVQSNDLLEVNTTIAKVQSEQNTIQSTGTQPTVQPDPPVQRAYNPILAMAVKRASALKGNGSTEPEIVEGVSYLGMTNYGTPPTNQEPIDTKEITPKAELVKRYVNVFTPNGDGKNDFFFLESEGLTDFSVVVFDPTGEIAFKSSDPNFKWDGRDIRTGEFVSSGTYMYMVSAYDADGNPYPIYERLTVNR